MDMEWRNLQRLINRGLAIEGELYLPVNVGLFRKYEELQAKNKKRMKEFPLLNAKFQELNENAKACFELEKEVVVVS
ncbi:hypothetical protein Tco_0852456 [Tanacetum coccineum]